MKKTHVVFKSSPAWRRWMEVVAEHSSTQRGKKEENPLHGKARRRWLVLYTQHEEEEEEERGGLQELRPCVTDMEFLIDPARGPCTFSCTALHAVSIPSYTHTQTHIDESKKEKTRNCTWRRQLKDGTNFLFPFLLCRRRQQTGNETQFPQRLVRLSLSTGNWIQPIKIKQIRKGGGQIIKNQLA